MARKEKRPRIETEADGSPLSLSLGALLGREERLRSPEEVLPEELKPPSPPRELPGRVVLSRETKGRGGKTVTRLSFREGAPSDVEGLAKKLRGTIGCGGTVEDGDILLQGDQMQRARSWFEARDVRVTGPS
ncbi:MAG: translation initiation factor [Synergistaceae bacterium]|nr:translation initiation factor [Synergistota bacterium]NLM71486.1 translation initiation factor [Synergistaceae bacterium]